MSNSNTLQANDLEAVCLLFNSKLSMEDGYHSPQIAIFHILYVYAFPWGSHGVTQRLESQIFDTAALF